MLCNGVIGGPMLYKMAISSSSKIFVTLVFWRLRNHTFDGHISGLEQDRDNLKPLLPTKSPMACPIDWCHCRVCHVTILLPVWRFWPSGVCSTKRHTFACQKCLELGFFCDYVIRLRTVISRDWSKIGTIWNHFCPQSRLCPIHWCHWRVGHVTVLLPVWRFWPFGVIFKDPSARRAQTWPPP